MLQLKADKKLEQNAVPADSYKTLDADRDLVLSAASSLDVPVNIRNKLYAALKEVLKQPEVIKSMNNVGAEPGGITPAEFKTFIHTETEKWVALAHKAGIKAE